MRRNGQRSDPHIIKIRRPVKAEPEEQTEGTGKLCITCKFGEGIQIGPHRIQFQRTRNMIRVHVSGPLEPKVDRIAQSPILSLPADSVAYKKAKGFL